MGLRHPVFDIVPRGGTKDRVRQGSRFGYTFDIRYTSHITICLYKVFSIFDFEHEA